jgi:predicted MFS family arabinose efflux permease
MFGPFITYWFFKRFGAGPAKIGFLYAIVNLASLSSAISAAPLARRFGIVKASTFLRFAQSILLFPLALAPNFIVASAIYLIRMLAQRAALPLRQSFAVAMAHPDERARVAALSNLPSQVFSAASPSLSGWMFDNLSLSIPFEIGGLLQLLSGLLYYHFFKATRPEEELDESG